MWAQSVATAPPAGYVTDLFKALEDLLEHPEPAPPDEAIVNRVRPTIVGGRIAPSQAVPDDEDDAADDPTAIHPRHTARQRKIRLEPAHLRVGQPDQTLIATPPHAAIESTDRYLRKQFNWS